MTKENQVLTEDKQTMIQEKQAMTQEQGAMTARLFLGPIREKFVSNFGLEEV